MYGESAVFEHSLPTRKAQHLRFLRSFYFLVFVLLLLGALFTNFALVNAKAANFVRQRWPVAIIAAVIAAILSLLSYSQKIVRRKVPALALYLLFAPAFAYLCAWLVLREHRWLVYFGMWVELAAVFGYFVHSLTTNESMKTVVTFTVVTVAGLSVYLFFLVFTTVSFFGMVLTLMAEVVYCFYLNYEVRKHVRGALFDAAADNPWAAAVRVWSEAILVLFRFMEMAAYGCFKRRSGAR